MTTFLTTFENRSAPSPGGPFSPWVVQSQSTIIADEETKTKSGASTPGHNRLKNNGAILPVNPYAVSTRNVVRTGNPGQAVVHRENISTHEVSEERYTNWYSPYVETFEKLSLATTIDPVLINQAVNDAISQATQSLVMVPVTAIEARETLRMLKDAVKRLLNFATFIRDLASRRKESFSKLWLEYRLGWTPFYYELLGFISIMNGKLKEGDRQHGTGLRGQPSQKTQNWTFPINGWSVQSFETVNLSATVRGFALAEVSDSFTARYGTNPALVVWETITLSWLLDKFVSVGSWLSSLTTAMSGFSLVASGSSVKVTLAATKSAVFTPTPLAGQSVTGSPMACSYSLSLRSFTRNVGGGGGWPGFNRHFSATSITDILALIAQWYKFRV